MSRPPPPEIDLGLPVPPSGPATWAESRAWRATADVRAEWVGGVIDLSGAAER